MRATSQASLDAAMSTWETTLAATGSKAAQLGEELFAVVDVLDGSAALRRALTEPNRSEEHTSELQSRGHLVCRLLLEKKNEREPSQVSRETDRRHHETKDV